jgi:hypothetical protein
MEKIRASPAEPKTLLVMWFVAQVFIDTLLLHPRSPSEVVPDASATLVPRRFFAQRG